MSLLDHHPPLPPEVVPPLRPFELLRLKDQCCPVCSRTYTEGWRRARKLILARFSGESVRHIAWRFLMTPAGVRYHLRSAGALSDTNFCAHFSMMQTRYRIAPADLIAAGAVRDGDMWIAPRVEEPRGKRGRKRQ